MSVTSTKMIMVRTFVCNRIMCAILTSIHWEFIHTVKLHLNGHPFEWALLPYGQLCTIFSWLFMFFFFGLLLNVYCSFTGTFDWKIGYHAKRSFTVLCVSRLVWKQHEYKRQFQIQTSPMYCHGVNLLPLSYLGLSTFLISIFSSAFFKALKSSSQAIYSSSMFRNQVCNMS